MMNLNKNISQHSQQNTAEWQLQVASCLRQLNKVEKGNTRNR